MEKPVPILEELSAVARSGARLRQAEVPESALFPQAELWNRRTGCFAEALSGPALTLIAEHKRRSPSKGAIREDWGVVETVAAYEYGGAAAVSVLTEETRFGGSLEHLQSARAVTELPIIRKDFITDPYQLLEAKAAGADAALLIVGALNDEALEDLDSYARAIGLEVLVEVHDHAELERALRIEPAILGINNRDLRHPQLKTDTATTARLLAGIPEDTIVVTESGFGVDAGSRHALRELSAAGADAVLIGEALMRSPDPEEAVRFLLEGDSALS